MPAPETDVSHEQDPSRLSWEPPVPMQTPGTEKTRLERYQYEPERQTLLKVDWILFFSNFDAILIPGEDRTSRHIGNTIFAGEILGVRDTYSVSDTGETWTS